MNKMCELDTWTSNILFQENSFYFPAHIQHFHFHYTLQSTPNIISHHVDSDLK